MMMHTALPEQAIRERAYALWEMDGHCHGRALHHWLTAERDLLAEAEAAAAVPRRGRAAAAMTAKAEVKAAKPRARRAPKKAD